jgi:hypothetical protein
LKTGQQEIARIPARTIEVNRAANEATIKEPEQDLIPLSSGTSGQSVVTRSSSDAIWRWLSILLAVGWSASILTWWIVQRGFNLRRTESTNPLEISLRKAKKRLYRACADNNAADARKALLSWANVMVVGRKFNNLNQVVRYFGNPLKQQVDLLNQSSYGSSAGDWNGESLWITCEEISNELMPSDQPGTLSGLQPLNP